MFGADIGLTTKHVLKIMAEADNNDDGVIEYKECKFAQRLSYSLVAFNPYYKYCALLRHSSLY